MAKKKKAKRSRKPKPKPPSADPTQAAFNAIERVIGAKLANEPEKPKGR